MANWGNWLKSGAATPMSTWCSRRYTTCVITKDSLCDCGCEGYHTIQDVNSVFSWSMGFLRGKQKAPWSRHDTSPFTKHDRKHRMPAGKALPTACLVQVRGDWDWMSQAYRFRRANELYFCWLCQVRQDNFRSQIRRNAPFRATLRTHMASLAEVLASGGD